MKAWVVAVIAGAVGLIAGCGMTWYEFAGVQESFEARGEKAKLKEGPKLVIEGSPEHHFGSMQAQATKSHAFVIRNTGNAPLELTAGDKTCQCVTFDVPSKPIPPGGSSQVLLEWKPKEFNQDFRQSADLKSNDPAANPVKLIIRGSVVRFAQAFPAEVTFGGISAGEERSTQVRVLCFSEEPLKVAEHEFLSADSASFFDATWEDLPPAEITEPLARSGILLTITAKSGLPLGQINQTIRLSLEGPDDRTLEIPIRGTIASDISILGGRTFDATNNLLRLGLVKGAEGHKTQLRISVKGPHRRDVKLSLAEVDPENVLRVTLAEPTEVNGGRAMVHLLTVEVPPGTPPINRIVSELNKPGRILIDTTHPDVKQLRISVSFAVQE
jgi:hypothetical protein